ncbi:MAG: hypothetical protein Q9186_004833 [Xanthomendoza sp. 1 TL-2023]
MSQSAARSSLSGPGDVHQLTLMLSKLSISTTARHGAGKFRSSNRGCPFLKLPPEIRNLIYRECLVVEGIINPYPQCYQDKCVVPKGQFRPSVALLRVSKRIKCEAQAILCGENTWHLNSDTSYTGQNSVHRVDKPLWDCFTAPDFANKIGHIIISFDFRDLDHNSLGPIYSSSAWAQALLQPRRRSLATPTEAAHSFRYQYLYQIWRWKIRVLALLVLGNTEGLTLDFSNCYCPAGCCRLAKRVLDTLRLEGHFNESTRAIYLERLHWMKLTITGLLDEPEKKYYLEMGFPPALGP